ncbi:hypothetical protein NHQ30_004494 [Ciborinia camelliae]|nr:hypothetical protein NHQ30_004494 [Ciborinia camelliae]
MADQPTVAPISHEVESTDDLSALLSKENTPEKDTEADPEEYVDHRNSDLSNSQKIPEVREESDLEDQPMDQSRLNQALLDAAKNKDEAEVMKLLAQGADLSAVDILGRTALFCTAESGLTHATRAIISKYPESVNFQDEFEHAPLDTAVRRGQLTMVEILLENNEKVDAQKNFHGYTVLSQAAQNGHGNIVEFLLAKNAKVDLQDRRGNTALHYAAQNGHDNIVEYLLAKKAKIDLQNKSGQTPLHIAISRCPFRYRVDDHIRVVRILSGAMKGWERKEELLRIASLEENTIKISFLCEALDWTGLESEELTLRWRIKLVWNACRGSNHEAACEILKYINAENVANDDKKDSENWKALEWAAYFGDHVVVWWLLVSGSREEMDIHRMRALKLAERQKQEQTGKEASYSLTIDILNDPPLVQGWSESDEPYRYPELDAGSKESSDDFDGPSKKLLQEFEGTIVDFYRHDEGTRIDFLRRTRTIWDTIYEKPKASETDGSEASHSTSGPAKIMEEARENLKKIGSNSLVARQELYSEADLRLRWVHLPANNMEWMMDLAMRVYKDKKKTKEEYRSLREFMNQSWHELPGSRSELNYMSATCAMPYLTFSKYYKPGSEPTEPTEPSKKVDKLFKAYQIQNRNDNKDNGESTSTNNSKILHSSRTLDQFYYHSMTNTDDRDSSQVVTRYAGRKPEAKAWDILRVDHLWLWVIDEKTIITSSTSRLDDQEDPVLEGIFDSLKKAKGKRNGQPPPSSVDEMCKYITDYCIEIFDKPALLCKRDKYDISCDKYDRLSVRQIFSNSINNATNEEIKLFMKFKHKINDKVKRQDYHHDTSEQPSPKPEDQEKEYESISKATDLLLEQKTVWEKVFEVPPDFDESVEESGLPRHKETERWKGPGLAINNVLEMDKLAQRIQESVNSVLSLEQNEANLSETESTREQTQVTIDQGKTIMVFTIITIIFIREFLWGIVTVTKSALDEHSSKHFSKTFIGISKAGPNKKDPTQTNGTEGREKQPTRGPPDGNNSSTFQNDSQAGDGTIEQPTSQNNNSRAGEVIIEPSTSQNDYSQAGDGTIEQPILQNNNLQTVDRIIELSIFQNDYLRAGEVIIGPSTLQNDYSQAGDGTIEQPTSQNNDSRAGEVIIEPSTSQNNYSQAGDGTIEPSNQSAKGFLARTRRFIGTRTRRLLGTPNNTRDLESLGVSA